MLSTISKRTVGQFQEHDLLNPHPLVLIRFQNKNKKWNRKRKNKKFCVNKKKEDPHEERMKKKKQWRRSRKC